MRAFGVTHQPMWIGVKVLSLQRRWLGTFPHPGLKCRRQSTKMDHLREWGKRHLSMLTLAALCSGGGYVLSTPRLPVQVMSVGLYHLVSLWMRDARPWITVRQVTNMYQNGSKSFHIDL